MSNLSVHPMIFNILLRHSMFIQMLMSNPYDQKHIMRIAQKMTNKGMRKMSDV